MIWYKQDNIHLHEIMQFRDGQIKENINTSLTSRHILDP